jgi:hypothetical protein
MTNWQDTIRERIRQNLLHIPEPQRTKVLDELMEEVIRETESGLPFGGIVEVEKKPEPEPVTSRGEKLSSLRMQARKFGNWEPQLHIGEK